MTDTVYTVDLLFAGKDETVRAVYSRLLEVLKTLGPFEEEAKKTSIHLVHNGGFAGVHPRKSYLYLNLRTKERIESPRIAKAEQVSKNRFHNEVKLAHPDEVDAELTDWLRAAYTLN